MSSPSSPLMPSVPLMTVRTPSCLSSFGAARSCLGLALDGWTTAEIWSVSAQPSSRPCTNDELRTQRAMESVWEAAGVNGSAVRVLLHNDASPASAVGSREASIVAGLVAGNELVGGPMQQTDLLGVGAREGGRAEGLAASLLGGLQMASPWGEKVAVGPVRLPLGITLVLFLMENTDVGASAPLPDPGPWPELDGWRTALLVNAMASSRLEQLASHDALQPAALYPQSPGQRLTCAGAMIGGALAALPADEGRALVALTQGREMTVVYEMAEAARQAGLEGATKIVKPSSRGAYIT